MNMKLETKLLHTRKITDSGRRGKIADEEDTRPGP